MTHIETPLEPMAASRIALEGLAQADRAVELLRSEFLKCFADATRRSYDLPGIRQTSWIRAALAADAPAARPGWLSIYARNVTPRPQARC